MKVNIQQITGTWDVGYVLDWHTESSAYIGDDEHGNPQFDTTRTEIGEAVYRLKYRSDTAQAERIATQFASSLMPRLDHVSFVVPIPPSKQRRAQPVLEIARRVAAKLGVPCIEDLLTKTNRTPQMKDIALRDDRLKALASVLKIKDVLPDGKHNVLVVDDVYDSGSSLEAASRALRGYSKIQKIYVATATRTK